MHNIYVYERFYIRSYEYVQMCTTQIHIRTCVRLLLHHKQLQGTNRGRRPVVWYKWCLPAYRNRFRDTRDSTHLIHEDSAVGTGTHTDSDEETMQTPKSTFSGQGYVG
jgi:hypothetical protein